MLSEEASSELEALESIFESNFHREGSHVVLCIAPEESEGAVRTHGAHLHRAPSARPGPARTRCRKSCHGGLTDGMRHLCWHVLTRWVAVCLSQATYPSEFRLDWCVGSQCFDHSISCAQFQLRIRGYYEHDRRPPLREAMFLVTLPPVYQREMLLGCPGMVVLAHLLVAESRLYTHEVTEALELVSRAQAMLQLPEIAGVHAEGVQNAWPLQTALGRVDGLLAWLDTGRMPLSADIVLPHCREDLSWLGNSSLLQVLPARTRIFVYEKCGAGEDLAAVLSPLLEPHVQLILARLDDVADPATGLSARRDECTAYLSHVVTHFGDLGDLTFFLHGDPSDHTPFGLLNLVFRAVALGTLNQLDFAHLGAPRLVATYNPCQDDIYRRAVGREPGRLYTYCCSQFLVSKRRIMQRPLEQYLQMLQLVDGSVPDLCQRIGPSYEKYAGQRLSHCFFLEFMWHVVFGEPDELPLRADDTSLPLFLRLKDNEERPPSVWKSYMTPFLGGYASFQGHQGQGWLRQIRTHVDLGPVQQHFGDGLEL
ncbi:unnamed protein product [Effrenium voratum]|nr:unnamed protein product [Effrenium voratum]